MPKALRTTVIGSYPFPSWLELASGHLDRFGPADLAEIQDDAAVCAIHDQLAAGAQTWTRYAEAVFKVLRAPEARAG